MSRARHLGFTAAAMLLTLALNGCGPSATEGGFDSANPAARLYATEEAVRRGDRSAIPDIIQLLDSDDSAVRFLAIGALERLTGRTYGYDHADPPPDRKLAVRRWVEAHQSGELNELLSASGSRFTINRDPRTDN